MNNNKLYEEASLWIQKEKEGLSELQKYNFDKWMKIEENRNVYNDIANIEKSIFNMSDDLKEKLRKDVNEELERNNSFKPFLIAACLLLFIGIGIFKYDFQEEPLYSKTFFSEYSVKQGIVLPDNSSISLDAKTKLKVNFFDDKREVSFFKGRVLFDISKDEKRAFTIYTKNNTVEVLGTKFEVAIKNDVTTVKVKEGIVKVGKLLNNKNSKIVSLLEKEDTVSLNKFGEVISIKKLPVEKIAIWEDKNIFFNDTPLYKAINEFSKYTKMKINIDKTLESVEVTGKFKTDELDRFIHSLPLIYPIEVKKTDSTFFIKKIDEFCPLS